ncbi:MAG: cell division protein ZapA [Thermoanaerobaculia bacterium]|nr:cell division protein ZapA [Thermoanaerobaculia bacterium]
MGKSTPQSTRLEIFGGVYTVRGDHDAERLEELAAKVDGDMRQIAKQLSTVDPTRIAILAALNIADELFQCRQRIDGDRTQMTERLVQLSDQLAGALES